MQVSYKPRGIAVAITDLPRTDPYLQNYRIRLLPWIVTSEPLFGIRMDNLRVGKLSAAEFSKLGPGHPVCPLRPASQKFQPEFLDRRPKLVQTRRVQWDCVADAFSVLWS